MGISLKQIISINKTFMQLINKNEYEKLVLELMNKSSKVFPNTYKKIEIQNNNQCDFIDVETNEKFEAKLFLTKKEGELIASNNRDYEKWLNIAFERIREFSEFVEARGSKPIENLTIYKIFELLLSKIEQDENMILLFLYPVTLDLEDSIVTFLGDVLTTIYHDFNKKGMILNRKIYVIYPTIDNKIVVRLLNSNQREYFIDNNFSEFLKYELQK